MYVGEEHGHEGVLLFINININHLLTQLVVSLELHNCGEVLFEDNRCYEICSLAEQEVVLFRPTVL